MPEPIRRLIEIVWLEVIPDLERHIASSPQAAAALAKFTDAGCDRQKILRALYSYGGGTAADVAATKTDFVHLRKNVRSQARRLIAGGKALTETYMDIGRVVEIHIYDGLPGNMAQAAERLLRMVDPELKRLASERTNGRDHHIAFVAQMVKTVTGRAHYKELPDHVNTVEGTYQSDYRSAKDVTTAESIRKLVKRCMPIDLSYDYD